MDNSISAPNSDKSAWTLEDVKSYVGSHPIVAFVRGTASSPKCGFSAQLISLLEANGLNYSIVDISQQKNLSAALKRFSGCAHPPVVFVNGVLANCYEAAEAAIEELRESTAFDGAMLANA